MSLPRVHAPYFRIFAALIAASSVSACVLTASPEPAPFAEDALPAASIKPTCPSGGCHPQATPAGMGSATRD